ncbi:MAG TPA: translation initiation factor IF-3 [Candidatus Levybacteria bacterium]|nr:translation initiation factor IF-3 [Candidatus Levybacteria bacterium]
MRKRPNQTKQPYFRINHQIRAKEVRLLDSEGKQIGVVSVDEARRLAVEQELDLVEIAPLATPPVAKIIDYSKFLYQLKKKKQEEKKKTVTSETKQIRMGPFIGNHDLEIKVRHAKEFLEDGDKVKFIVRFRGREFTKKELGENVLKKVIEMLAEVAKVERDPHMEGRQMVMMVSRLK